jgi:hypothetical protein
MGRNRKATTWQDPILSGKLFRMEVEGPCVIVQVGEQMLIAKTIDEIKIYVSFAVIRLTW